jgi:hypothetical protein
VFRLAIVMSQAIPPTSRATPASTGFATYATATVVAAITTEEAETSRFGDALCLKPGRSRPANRPCTETT